MEKAVIALIIFCNMVGLSGYAEELSKLEYIENSFILERAVKNTDSLSKHLERYTADAQELKTGNTVLHLLSFELEQIHLAMKDYSKNFQLIDIMDYTKNQYLENKYREKQDLIEYLIVQGAHPYIKNKKGERIMDSKGFDLYVSYVLKTQTLNPNKKIYDVYLAGPEVFLPTYEKVSRFLKTQILLFNKYHLKDSNYHIQGVFPIGESEKGAYSGYFQSGTEIYKKNKSLMDSSHAIIANMTRHKESSMDVGTAYDVGAMAQAQKTVIGYYNENIYHLYSDGNEELEKESSDSAEDFLFYKDRYVYGQKALLSGNLKMPDHLMVVTETLFSNWKIQTPSSSWEALFALKSKLDINEK